MTTQSGVVATNQPGVAVPGWLSNAITGVDAVYSGVLQFAEESIKHTPAGRVIRLVDLASGTVHSVASNGGFNERAYISAASSYAGGAFGSAMGSFAGPLGSALGATAGSYLGAKAGEFLYDNPTFVADKLAELEDLGGEIARAVEDGIANLSETALDSYENFASEAESFLENALDRLEQFSRTLGGEFTQLADALADLAGNLGDALGDLLGGLWGGLQGEGDGDGGLTGAAGMLAPAGIAGLVGGLFAAAGLISPLVLDLDGDGIELSTLAETGALFDLDGDGFAEKTGWVRPDDGILAIDLNGNGLIEEFEGHDMHLANRFPLPDTAGRFCGGGARDGSR